MEERITVRGEEWGERVMNNTEVQDRIRVRRETKMEERLMEE